MTNEEIVKLIQQGINVTANMELLYTQNRRFMYSLAKKTHNTQLMDDLMQEAYFGLIKAVDRYDESRGIKFLTYAAFWIRQEVNQFIVNNKGNIPIPSGLYHKINQYKKFLIAYYQENNKDPRDIETIEFLEVTKEQFEVVKKLSRVLDEVSIYSEVAGSEESISIEETLASDVDIESDTIEALYNDVLKEDAWGLVDSVCSSHEKELLELRYRHNMSFNSIGAHFGLSGSAVSQRLGGAYRKLRKGKIAREFKEKYYGDIYSQSLRGGVNAFKTTWTSPTERAALNIYEL